MANRTTFHWSPGQTHLSADPRSRGGSGRALPACAEGSEAVTALRDALSALPDDRLATAAEIVQSASQALMDWALARASFDWDTFHERWVRDLDAVQRSHAWRGPVARWFGALSGLEAEARARGIDAPQALVEELGLWLDGAEKPATPEVWDGRSLSPGARLPRREACAEAVLSRGARMAVGETLALLSGSWSAQCAVIALQQAGFAPRVLLPEGAPHLWGRRVATRLIEHGVHVTLTYDAALHAALGSVDRLWTGTEAIGAGSFLAPVGAAAWFEEARRLELPTCIVATSDKLMPAGELFLPAEGADDGWLLWDEAPRGVELRTRALEPVCLDRIDAVACELGLLGVGQLALRALVTEHSPAPERRPHLSRTIDR